MNRLFALLLISLFALTMVGCSDDTLAPPDEDPPETPKVTTVDNNDGTFTATIDAGYVDATEWIYFSFGTTDAAVAPVDPTDSTEWDLAFKFANILVNGGANGTGMGAIFPYDDADFALLDTAPDEVFFTDSGTDDPGQCFNTGTGWYDYNYTTHAFAIRADRYYAVRLADGSYVKLKLVDFVDDAGTPGYPAFTWSVIAAGDYGVSTATATGLGSTSVVASGNMGAADWTYLSFATGLQATPADPADATDWDLALSFADIALNGGFNGTGGVEVVAYDDGGYDALTQAPAAGYNTDTGDGSTDADLAFNVGDGWYSYDPMTHAFSVLPDRYYVVHTVDDTYFKVRVTGFDAPGGTDAHVTLAWDEILAP